MTVQKQRAPMTTVDAIRERIHQLYQSSPRVHITVQMPHTKVVQDAEVTITGVYPHVFCVEEPVGGTMQRHTFQYVDVLTRRVGIGTIG